MSQTRGKPLDYGILPDLLAYWLRRAKSRFSQHFQSIVGQDGITLGQFDVLTLIARNPGLTQTVLARAIGIERSTMVVVIDRLEGRGLVCRHPRDKRSYALRLTKEGEAVVEYATRRAREHEAALTTGLNPSERQVLGDLLARLANGK